MIAKTISAPMLVKVAAMVLSQSFRVVVMIASLFEPFHHREHRGFTEEHEKTLICLDASLCPLWLIPLLLVQNPQPIIRSISLHGWLIHQLDPRRSNLEFARHLHAHGVLLRRVAVEVIHEDRRAVIAEFTIAVPVAPIAERIVQIDSADAPDLFSARGN